MYIGMTFLLILKKKIHYVKVLNHTYVLLQSYRPDLLSRHVHVMAQPSCQVSPDWYFRALYVQPPRSMNESTKKNR